MSKPTEWTTVITSEQKWWHFDIIELIRYRDLITLFVKRDFITQYKQTVLGPLWFILQPVLSTIMFMLVFGAIAKIPTDGVPAPLFYMGGLVVWNLFASTVQQTSVTLTSNAHLFSKVYFPRLAIPIAQLIAGFGRFVIQFIIFAALIIIYISAGWKTSFSISLLAFPFVLIHAAILAFGVGLIISAVTTRYRDLQIGLQFGMQLWMYATPIVYPLSLVPEKWRIFYALNPIVPVLEVFKHMFFGTALPEVNEYLLSSAVTVILFVLGLIIFNKVQRTFIDTV